MSPFAQQVTVLRRNVVYPDSDGEPLGETDFHITAILYLRSALRWLFRDLKDVYVAANMLFYYEKGEPASRISPDVFVVRGIDRHDRRSYQLWKERVPPCLVVEVTSRSSRFEDLGTKRGLYEMLGVSEYLVFDPLGDYLTPRFRVFELEDCTYKPADLSADGAYRSRLLPVVFKPEGPLLRAIDPLTSIPAPMLDEAVDKAAAETRRAEEQSRRAEDERRRAEEQSRRAEDERRRAETLEADLRRYRERFGDLDR